MNRILVAALAAACIAGAGPLATAGNTPQEEANKKTVMALYEAALHKTDYARSEKYLGPYYKQHNPLAEDGKEGLKKFIEWRKKALPNAKSVIKRIFADGDYVIVHVHSIREPGTRGAAIVDLYRKENGKVIEHWDVIQDTPDKPRNTNTMF
jgi:predicted SnoaL-like aldol condensation-catalyzing enzyme